MNEYTKIIEKVEDIIIKAGEVVLSYYDTDYKVNDKNDDNHEIENKENFDVENSPVTIADIESNKVIISGLTSFNYPVLSEEGVDDNKRFESEYVWIVDPMDGTKDFIQKTGEFTIMIALVKRKGINKYRPVLGLIYQPVNKTLYYAVEGEGAWKKRIEENAERMQVSDKKDLTSITMLTSRNHSSDLEKLVAKDLGIINIKTYGSSLKACLIANKTGEVNFNPSNKTKEWDICASDIIIHEAGGRFSDIEGNLINYNKKDVANEQGYLATNFEVFGSIVSQIKKNLL